MRYTVHTHRTFHHRITKYLGVLVASALIATLGLPSAAQAQTPEAPKVKGSGDGTVVGGGAITATWGTRDRYRPDPLEGRIYRAWRTMGRREGAGTHPHRPLRTADGYDHGE